MAEAAYTILDAIPADEQIAMVKAVAGGYRCTGAHCPTDDAVRGLIYSAVRLPAEKVATAIADFARKECFQTVAGLRHPRQADGQCLSVDADQHAGWSRRALPRAAPEQDQISVGQEDDQRRARRSRRQGRPVARHARRAFRPDPRSRGREAGDRDRPGRRRRAPRRSSAPPSVASPSGAPTARTTASVPAELKEFKAEIAAGARDGQGDRSGPDDADRPPAAHLAGEARLELCRLGGALCGPSAARGADASG